MSAHSDISTHPSPHARLATFKRGQQKLHQWAALLEQAFSDIQLGRNLSSALKTTENSFLTVPGNLYLLKAKAVALHKMWLETVTLKDQKLRAIIDLPSFRDDMVFSKLGSRAVRKQIPGDRKLWLQAKKAYEDSSTDAVDPGYYSNFAVLLAYSPEPKEEDLAGELAGTAAITDASIANLSNLAFVFYHTGQKEKALQLFAEIATEYNKSYTSFLQAAASDPVVVGSLQALRQQMKLIQQLNSEYVHSEFTPILNFALCLYYEEKKNLSVQVAKDYLDRYESSSLWADYLSKTTGVEIPELPAKSYMAVNGLKVGQTLKDVLRLWGKADETTGYDDGHELWYYDKLKASVYIQGGMVDVIELTSPESPKIEDRIGVGSSQQEIEQEYGKHKRTADKLLIYEGKQNLAVLYTRSIAAGIVLFR